MKTHLKSILGVDWAMFFQCGCKYNFKIIEDIVLTFKNAYFGLTVSDYDQRHFQKKRIQNDRILLQTNSPQLPFKDLKTEINFPQLNIFNAKRLAELKKKDLNGVIEMVNYNARRFFGFYKKIQAKENPIVNPAGIDQERIKENHLPTDEADEDFLCKRLEQIFTEKTTIPIKTKNKIFSKVYQAEAATAGIFQIPAKQIHDETKIIQQKSATAGIFQSPAKQIHDQTKIIQKKSATAGIFQSPAKQITEKRKKNPISIHILDKADAELEQKFRRDLISVADGNCFYWACSDHNNLFADRPKIDHITLRAQACQLIDDLRKSPDNSELSEVLQKYEEHYPIWGEVDLEELFGSQKKNGREVSEMYIYAAANILGQDIIVFDVENKTTTAFECFRESKKEFIVLGFARKHFQLLTI
jgi:hypothetical protein